VICGYVYVLSNPAMPGLVKIGQTTRSMRSRVNELSLATGVPKPFVVEAYYLSDDPQADEARIHEALAYHRAPGREFFAPSLERTLEDCTKTLGRHPRYIRSQHGDLEEL
jgi:hypothetical protein